MNLSAIYHQAFDAFCYPLDNDNLEITIKTGKDVERVFLHWADPFNGERHDGEFIWKSNCAEMTGRRELQEHFLWSATVTPPAKRCRYFFSLESQGETAYFLETGFYTEEQFSRIRDFTGCFTFPWMNPADINRTPEWAESAVFYQIFPSRFCRGKCSFQPEGLKEWGKYGEKAGWNDVYGGNLQGIIDRLDYLQSLGITGIYMTPINQARSQHKYDTKDYLTVDESFGTNETLRELVKKAHEHGIKIVLDGVFNHCGWDFFAWQDVLKNRQNSKYASWFMINDFNFELHEDYWKMHNSWDKKYFSFAFADFMPKLNTNNPEVREYLIGVSEKWVRDYDIDGIRMDVANEVSHLFVQEMRKAMLALKKDFYFIGEIWHNAQPWLRGNEFDSVMNYPLQNAILGFCEDIHTNAKDFEFAINRCYSMYSRQTNRVLFNQMDSHDTMRMITRFESNADRAKQALALLFSVPGTTCIYYGTEILLEGGNDPDNRRCMPWKEIEEGRFDETLSFMKKLILLRKTHPALRSSIIQFNYGGENADGKKRLIRYTKTAEDGGEKIEVTVNCSGKPVSIVNDGTVLLSRNLENGKLLNDGFMYRLIQ